MGGRSFIAHYSILNLHKAEIEKLRPDAFQLHICWHRSEKRCPFAQNDRDQRDRQFINQPGGKEPLNRDAPVHIEVVCALARETLTQLRRFFGRACDGVPN